VVRGDVGDEVCGLIGAHEAVADAEGRHGVIVGAAPIAESGLSS
jgi:hypothetical protein